MKLGVIRLESHRRTKDGVAAASSFPRWLSAASDCTEAMIMVLPIEGSSADESATADVHYSLRQQDALLALPSCRGFLRAYMNAPLLLLRLYKLRRHTPVVICRAPEHLNLILLPLLWLLRFKPVIWFVSDRSAVEAANQTRRGGGPLVRAGAWLSRATGSVERLFARRWPCIVNGSALERQLLEAGADAARILRVVSSTLPQSALPTQAPMEQRSGGPVELLYVGRIAVEKGLCDLIDALAELLKSPGPGYRLIVIGWAAHGEMERLRAYIVELGIEHAVDVRGPMPPGSALLQAFRSCDVFVLPSWSEGTPRVLVEAMAMGRAVVATRVGGVPDLIVDGENGHLVEPHRPDQLVAAIRRLALDPQRRLEIGRHNWEQARHLTVESLARRMCQFISR
ncbi:glycosyltransferase [Povalibacter sp.]|uniref:glycosyltransferase n=1 Tax=Povalibacter sp. TaxID=1962978 RepID=UPI002F3FF07C